MDDQLRRYVDAAVNAYDREARWWDQPPRLCAMSRARIDQFIKLDAPDMVIRNELKILRQKVAWMQSTRLGATVH
jgi:hypothetical protein